MKQLMMLLVAGLLGLGAATQSASASTFDLGTIDPGTTSGFVANLGVPAPVSFEDTINFSLAGVQNALIGTLTDLSAVLVPTDSLNFSLDLFSASDPTVLARQLHRRNRHGPGVQLPQPCCR